MAPLCNSEGVSGPVCDMKFTPRQQVMNTDTVVLDAAGPGSSSGLGSTAYTGELFPFNTNTFTGLGVVGACFVDWPVWRLFDTALNCVFTGYINIKTKITCHVNYVTVGYNNYFP